MAITEAGAGGNTKVIRKWCPILAGLEPMRKELYIKEQDESSALTVTKNRIQERMECAKEQCEWYNNGCPAHKGE